MGIDCLILGDLTDQTRNDDSINEIVVERMDPSFNNEWVVKSFSECSLLFLCRLRKAVPSPCLMYAGTEASKSSCQKIQLLVTSQTWTHHVC